jgi:hypothetical protein
MPILCEVPYAATDASGDENTKPTTEMLFLICFTRYPAELRRELVCGGPLAPFRDALTQAGHSFETESGAKIFCAVNQYEAVLACMETMDVRPYHVVVSATCRELVGRTVEKLPKALKVRIKDENVCAMVPAGIPPARSFAPEPAAKPRAERSDAKPWTKGKTSPSTDSTSEGSSRGPEDTGSSSPAWMPEEMAMPFTAPMLPFSPDGMVMPFPLCNDFFWNASAMAEWAKTMENQYGPVDLQQPVPDLPFTDELAWQIAELLEQQRTGVA